MQSTSSPYGSWTVKLIRLNLSKTNGFNVVFHENSIYQILKKLKIHLLYSIKIP